MRRGLTLIEVLLATALVALLAFTVAGVTRDLRTASTSDFDPSVVGEASARIEALRDEMGIPFRVWEIGQSHRETDGIIIERVPCDDCPNGVGRFEFDFDGFVLTRFEPVVSLSPAIAGGSSR
ncbi:MAG: prepilin-type N-terminal cleavage/methylation domain-containing protein [Planctomycetota bacterium]